MDMKIDPIKIIQKRKNRAWTQSHLAEVCDLSLRTIQRIEKTGVASQESIQALASVFECLIDDLYVAERESKQEEVLKEQNSKAKIITKVAYFLIAFIPLIVVLTNILGVHLMFDITKNDGVRRTISSSSTLYMLLAHTKMIYFTFLPGILLLLFKKVLMKKNH